MYRQNTEQKLAILAALQRLVSGGQFRARSVNLPAFDRLAGRQLERPAQDVTGLDGFDHSQLGSELGGGLMHDPGFGSAPLGTSNNQFGSIAYPYAGHGGQVDGYHGTPYALAGNTDANQGSTVNHYGGSLPRVQGFTPINGPQVVNYPQQYVDYGNVGAADVHGQDVAFGNQGDYGLAGREGLLASGAGEDHDVFPQHEYVDANGNLYQDGVNWGLYGMTWATGVDASGCFTKMKVPSPAARKKGPKPQPGSVQPSPQGIKKAKRVVGSPNSRKGQTRLSSKRTQVVANHILRYLSENEVSGENIINKVVTAIRGNLPADIQYHYGTKLALHNVLGQTKGFRGIIGDKIAILREKGYLEASGTSGTVVEAGKQFLNGLSAADFQ